MGGGRSDADEDDAGRFEHVRDVEREPKPLAVPLQELREPRLVEGNAPLLERRDALRHDIPNDDLDYHTWVRVAEALKAALGDVAGWSMFKWWSEQSRNYDQTATEKAWKYFKPNRIGAGTIFHLAGERRHV